MGIQQPTTNAVLMEAHKTELETLNLKDLKTQIFLSQSIDYTALETILCNETSNEIRDSMK